MSTIKPFNPRWRYDGDINVEEGGIFWRPGSRDPFPIADYVEAVRVTPCSDAGGPSNVYVIESGSIYMPRDRYESALQCSGFSLVTGARGALLIGTSNSESVPINSPQGCEILVHAFLCYYGIESNYEHVVQIGARDSYYQEGRGGWNPTPHKTLRGDASLRRYVRKEFLI